MKKTVLLCTFNTRLNVIAFSQYVVFSLKMHDGCAFSWRGYDNLKSRCDRYKAPRAKNCTFGVLRHGKSVASRRTLWMQEYVQIWKHKFLGLQMMHKYPSGNTVVKSICRSWFRCFDKKGKLVTRDCSPVSLNQNEEEGWTNDVSGVISSVQLM